MRVVLWLPDANQLQQSGEASFITDRLQGGVISCCSCQCVHKYSFLAAVLQASCTPPCLKADGTSQGSLWWRSESRGWRTVTSHRHNCDHHYLTTHLLQGGGGGNPFDMKNLMESVKKAQAMVQQETQRVQQVRLVSWDSFPAQ